MIRDFSAGDRRHAQAWPTAVEPVGTGYEKLWFQAALGGRGALGTAFGQSSASLRQPGSGIYNKKCSP